MTTLRTSPPRKNSVPSDERLSIDEVKPRVTPPPLADELVGRRPSTWCARTRRGWRRRPAHVDRGLERHDLRHHRTRPRASRAPTSTSASVARQRRGLVFRPEGQAEVRGRTTREGLSAERGRTRRSSGGGLRDRVPDLRRARRAVVPPRPRAARAAGSWRATGSGSCCRTRSSSSSAWRRRPSSQAASLTINWHLTADELAWILDDSERAARW